MAYYNTSKGIFKLSKKLFGLFHDNSIIKGDPLSFGRQSKRHIEENSQ
jgi:hypothetical protein